MKILSIETSCDETAVSIVEVSDIGNTTEFKILGNALLSQINLHREYGGVFPALAKREHSQNLLPLLKQVLKEAGFRISNSQFSISKPINKQIPNDKIKEILNREPELLAQFLEFIPTIEVPEIDAIAVTQGPGLEPALWVGINFARALSLVWNKSLVPVNHMEGHVFSALLKEKRGKDEFPIFNFQFPKLPLLALLISGGHTQLVLSKEYLQYEIIGETLDDAVGEAFDKVARLLGLPYPGGPEISKLAEIEHAKTENTANIKAFGCPTPKLEDKQEEFIFPRPMLHSDTCNFSFSGLKTAVLYTVKKIPDITEEVRQKVAKEFEDAVVEVLITKTKKALEETGAQTLVIGGGVSANKKIKESLQKMVLNHFPDTLFYTPQASLSTDNAIMIAVAGYFRFRKNPDNYTPNTKIEAKGNMRLFLG